MIEPVLDLVVADRVDAADGVVALTLRDPAGGVLPGWTPGAHIDLLLTGELVRQYSLCGDPADPSSYRIAVLREPDGRGGSAFVHDKLLPDVPVRARGPRNNFELLPAPRYLFIAGGIGITPLLPMVHAAAAGAADWRLVYGGRTASSMAFADELRSAHGDRVELRAQDRYGLLDLDRLLARPLPDTLVYCCGPGPLLDAVGQRCAGWPAGSLHVERFTSVIRPTAGDDAEFEVELAQSGMTLRVPADRSLLEVLEEHGVAPLSSCREGTCGTCETAVLAGEVDHRDALLTEQERAAHDTMFPCMSRAACPKLVLEL